MSCFAIFWVHGNFLFQNTKSSMSVGFGSNSVSAYCSIEIHYYTIKEQKQVWTSENTAAVASYMINNYRQTHLQ